MSMTTLCKTMVPGSLAIVLALAAGPAGATVKPAVLNPSLYSADTIQVAQKKKKAKKKSEFSKKEKEGIERAKKYIPQEYHQYLPGGSANR
jgi:hypothetical protein